VTQKQALDSPPSESRLLSRHNCYAAQHSNSFASYDSVHATAGTYTGIK
jgi:hypothetical protein